MGFSGLINLIMGMLSVQFHVSSSQLIVNVKNNGGEIMQEVIESNTTTDTIRLSFEKFDGTSVTQFIDFRNEMQVFKAVVLGEEERNEPPHQAFCFITPFLINEFITSDAMSKLRQKNAEAIRHPEEEKEKEYIGLDMKVQASTMRLISPGIMNECKEARDNLFTNETALARSVARLQREQRDMMTSSSKRYSFYGVPECSNQTDSQRACVCNYEICVGWYPCGLKYCKGKDSAGKTVSYRCGIKTCKKCRVFRYYTPKKINCMWDEDFTDYFKILDISKSDKTVL